MIPDHLNPMGINLVKAMPLSLTAVTAGTIELHGYGTTAGLTSILYRLGFSGEWQPYTMNTEISLNAGQTLQWMNTRSSLSSDSANYAKFIFSGTVRGRGDCMSMLNWAAAAGYRCFSQGAV